MIDYSKSLRFTDCGYSRRIRRTDRVAVKSSPVASWLFKRIVPYLEPCIDVKLQVDDEGEIQQSGSWPEKGHIQPISGIGKRYPIGLNEVFRFNPYYKGRFYYHIMMVVLYEAKWIGRYKPLWCV